MKPLPPPVAGVPFDVETAAGRVAGYLLGEGRTVLLLHSFNAAGSGIELAPLASRLAEHRRVVLVDWLGFGTSDRPDAPYGYALFGDQLESIRVSALQPGESSVDVVALSLPGQHVVVAAAERAGAFRPRRAHQSDRIRPLQGQCRPNLPEHPPVPALDGDRPAAVRGPRSAPGDPLVPPADLRGSGEGPAAFTSGTAGGRVSSRALGGLLWRSCPGCSTIPAEAHTGGSRTLPSSSSGIIRASPTQRPRKRWSPRTNLERITIEQAGDLPQLERPDETAAVIDRFLA